MPDPVPQSVSTPSRRTSVLALLLCLMTAFAMQGLTGAWQADLASDFDEPAHAVTSLMVHDYLRQGLAGEPLAFAEQFAAHYQKIGIGHWPPLFYGAEAVWMIGAGRSRVAMLVFVALCGAALLYSVFMVLLRRQSLLAACVGTVLLAVTPLFRQMLYAVRPDLLLALLVLWAAVFAGEYLRDRRRSQIWFSALLAFSAIMVHGRGGLLVLLPLCFLPFRPVGQRVRVGWAVAATVGVLLALLPRVLAPPEPLRWFFPWFFLVSVVHTVGVPLLLLLSYASFYRRWRPTRDPLSATMLAVIAAGFLFHMLTPGAWDESYVIAILPAFAVLAGTAAEALSKHEASVWPPSRMVYVLLGLLLAAGLMVMPSKPSAGFRLAVSRGLLDGHPQTLIAGDPGVEGGLIAEAALRDPRLQFTVYRGSKLLSGSSWKGRGYHMLRSSPRDVLLLLDEKNISLVVMESEGGSPAVWQLREAMRQGAAQWQPQAIDVSGVSAYRRVR